MSPGVRCCPSPNRRAATGTEGKWTMRPRMAGMLFSAGIAALLAGAVGAVPAAATSGLHVVASPVIPDSCLSGAAVIGPGDGWAVGDIGTGTGCNPFQAV